MLTDELQYQADRSNLHKLRLQSPKLSKSELALRLNRSISWVKKWLRRFREAPDPDDPRLIYGLPRGRKTPPPPPNPVLVQRILDIRDHPPQNLRRVPGPKTIAYYLHSDQVLVASHLKPPSSASFIWKILDKNGRISRMPKGQHKPMELPEPMSEWEVDFKDASSVKVGVEGKRAHLVEILDIIDVGTSILVEALPSDNYNAQTALSTVAAIFKQHGLPKVLRFDHDPRWLGSQTGRDFPGAFIKFLHCIGITPDVCPPRRPDRNGHIERFHRSLGSECLNVFLPADLGQTSEVVSPYKEHYNRERPHQGAACNNQPPLKAFSKLPELPALPLIVDPERWLNAFDKHTFTRRVVANGSVKVDKYSYYLKKGLAGERVSIEIDGAARELIFRTAGSEGPGKWIKQIPIKGMQKQELAYEDYLKLMEQEALSEVRREKARLRAKLVISNS